MTIAQAAELTGLSKVALRRRVERGTIAGIQRGGRRMIPLDELRRHNLIDADAAVPNEVASPAPPLTTDDALDRLEAQAQEIGRLRAELDQANRELEAWRVLRDSAS